MGLKHDFSGWATKNDLECSDGRVICQDAFKECDGQTVPLVWGHKHDSMYNVLGHVLLKNESDGVYAYGFFNDTEDGKHAKSLVEHGDITAMSIYANKLKQQGNKVVHGAIREVSLVLAGANPGALIREVLAHSDDSEDCSAVIYTDELISLSHADDTEPASEDKKEKTIGDVIDSLTDEQKKIVYGLVGSAVKDSKKDDEEKGGKEEMKHNMFSDTDKEKDTETVISHDEMMSVISDGKRYGSLKESALQHGITDIEYLFPDAKTIASTPDFIKREDSWVTKVMNSTHHTPFSRIKSMFADITEDEARAKGYIKGKLKKEEVFSLLKRVTTPQTVYKKQKLDRDDVIDITDFDVVAWLKTEMRMMLNEELARAILVGDGRLASNDDKISADHIRPIWTDDDLYTVKVKVDVPSGANADTKAKATIRAMVKSRKNYKGSGNPVLFTTEDVLTDMLLMEDTTGRIIYETEDKLRTALRVREIVTVPVMEGLTREVTGSSGTETRELLGIIVNLADYNVGADRGGAINMFDDFDIDYNAQKYLIETRCSGALIKPYSAIAIEAVSAG